MSIIRLVRRELEPCKEGFIPVNEFDIDLSLGTISVLNRTTKDGYTHPPYELFTGKQISITFATSELVIVEKAERDFE